MMQEGVNTLSQPDFTPSTLFSLLGRVGPQRTGFGMADTDLRRKAVIVERL